MIEVYIINKCIFYILDGQMIQTRYYYPKILSLHPSPLTLIYLEGLNIFTPKFEINTKLKIQNKKVKKIYDHESINASI